MFGMIFRLVWEAFRHFEVGMRKAQGIEACEQNTQCGSMLVSNKVLKRYNHIGPYHISIVLVSLDAITFDLIFPAAWIPMLKNPQSYSIPKQCQGMHHRMLLQKALKGTQRKGSASYLLVTVGFSIPCYIYVEGCQKCGPLLWVP